MKNISRLKGYLRINYHKMKKLFTLIFIAFGLSSFGQKEEIFKVVESMPEPIANVQAYFDNNIRFSKHFVDEYTYPVTFRIKVTVMADGSLKNAEIARSNYPEMDNHIKALFVNMPKWKPGRNGERFVNCFSTTSVSLKYSDGMVVDTMLDYEYHSKLIKDSIAAAEYEIARIAKEKREALELAAQQKADEAAFRKECIKDFGAKLGNIIADGEVRMGMTKAMCERAIGSPSRESETLTGGNTYVTYYYSRKYSSYSVLMFKNNQLYSITK